jgi:transposase
MRDATFFTHPSAQWQRRYEALRASFVQRLPAKLVADRFGYTKDYVRLLRHQFQTGKLDLCEPIPEGRASRRTVGAEQRRTICQWRQQRLSAGQIAELLHEDGVEISVSTVERVLAEEGFSKLPRRTRLKIDLTVQGAQVPDNSVAMPVNHFDSLQFQSENAGIFLFAPFIAQLDFDKVLAAARLPGTKAIGAANYLMSFLALKLLGDERYGHVGQHSFDRALGLFTGLNVLPKCTAMSTYSYSLDQVHLDQLQSAFVQQVQALGLYDGSVINLDFHTVPHFGDQSELEKHCAGARGRTMKGALTLFAQDTESKLMLYTQADIKRSEADDQVLQFFAFWKSVRRGVLPTLVFDSRLTTYQNLSRLNAQGVKFITLRRRGAKLVQQLDNLAPWTRIHIPYDKRKYPNPQVHDSAIELRGYDGQVRQVVVRGNGREKPAFLVSNDFDSAVEVLVGTYARRWRVENGIAEAVKFFHLNSLSSPILTKVHFDVVLTAMADTLYYMLGQKLRGFEQCDAAKLYRHFVKGQGTVSVRDSTVTVTFARHAHNPILRRVPWYQLPATLPTLPGMRLQFKFL